MWVLGTEPWVGTWTYKVQLLSDVGAEEIFKLLFSMGRQWIKALICSWQDRENLYSMMALAIPECIIFQRIDSKSSYHTCTQRQPCEGMDANWMYFDGYSTMYTHTKAIMYILTIHTLWQLHLNKNQKKSPNVALSSWKHVTVEEYTTVECGGHWTRHGKEISFHLYLGFGHGIQVNWLGSKSPYLLSRLAGSFQPSTCHLFKSPIFFWLHVNQTWNDLFGDSTIFTTF